MPLADGNGRLGRLWQTLILSRWNPLLAWLPIEKVIRSRQQGYDESLGQADQQGDLEPFVAYQLEAIHDALAVEIRSEIGSEKGSELAAEIGATPGTAIDALILRDLATEPPSRHAVWQNVYNSASEQLRSIWLRSSKRGAYSAMAHPGPGIGRFCRLIPWHSSPKTIWSNNALIGSRNWDMPMPLLQTSHLMAPPLNAPISGR